MIVTWPDESVVASTLPTFSSCSHKRQPMTITEAVYPVLHVKNWKLEPKQVSNQKFSLQLLCEMAGAVILSNNAAFPPKIGAVLNISTVIRAVMSSVAKAELGALLLNAKVEILIQKTLKEISHLQTLMLVQTYNSMANGMVNDEI